MRILVTGANGLVGSRLCRLLGAAGHHVAGASRGPRRVEGPFDYLSADLTRPDEVARVLTEARAELIVNPASMTEVDACEKSPALAWATNAALPAELARLARESGAHLVHVSTDYVFDGVRGGYREEDVPNPRGVYAISKHAGEQAVRTIAGSWAIARTAVVFGWPPAARPNFGSWLLTTLARGETVRLFEDQFVSPTLADNLAEMLAELGTKGVTGVFHAAGADVVNRLEFGRAVCERFGFDPALLSPSRIADLKLASPRPRHSGLLVDKVAAALGHKPLRLAEALDRLYADFRAKAPTEGSR